ncbi:MAG: hypothetical protein ACFE91_11815 [Promethearchaeota archaeon]
MVEEKDKKEENKDILLEDSYEVNITAFRIDDYDNFYDDNVLWANKEAVDFLFEIVSLLKYETQGLVEFDKDLADNKFTRVTQALTLFSSEFLEKKDLEKVLLKYINDLGERKFKIRKQGSYKGSPDYKEIEITLDQIKEKFDDLRSHRINFYKKVLEEYKKNEKEYDDFMRATYSV